MFKSVDQALGGALARRREVRVVRRQGRPVDLALHARQDPREARARRRRRPAQRVLEPARSRHRRDDRAVPRTRSAPRRVAFVLPTLGANREPPLVQMAAEGVYLGTYKFGRYLTERRARSSRTTLKSFGDRHRRQGQEADRRAGAGVRRRGRARHDVAGGGQPRARSHQRAGRGRHADRARRRRAGDREEAQGHAHRRRCSTPKKCAELGMGMFLAVGQGTDQEPRFIHITYKPRQEAEEEDLLHRQGRHVRLGRLLAQAVAARWRT